MRRFGVIFFICVILFNLEFYYDEYKKEKLYIENMDKKIYQGSFKNEKRATDHVELENIKIKNIIKKEESIQYISDNIIINDFKKKDTFRIGDIISLSGKKQDLDNLHIKKFNYGRYLKSQDFTESIILEYGQKESTSNYFEMIGKFKNEIIDINKIMFKQNSAILNSMLLADKSGLTQDEKYIFSDTGTSHIMAISGLHIGIIVGVLVAVFGSMNRFRNIFIIYTILFIYNQVIGGGPSTMRAILMCTGASISYYLKRDLDLVNLIFVLAGFLIAMNKYIIYNISFDLSYLSVLSIVVFKKYIKEYVYSNFLAISLSVSILTMPLVLYVFNSISLITILANAIVVPLLGVIIVLDIFTIITYKISFIISSLFSLTDNLLLNFLKKVLSILGADGFNNFNLTNVDIKLILIYYFYILMISIYLERKYIKLNIYENSQNLNL
ncbi:ComEC/Rec2 family competence protein [Peptostreptococcus equinus]|uniref:ComEC/Rec2 family competence protein n=1 Tax=Peptostreptococcus equinus TaxID=3003601 RepID=A0ABY7JLJ4_9FIRM|nr:ComEC/Rec2 family competence protein [Peptostreptococcus sp. CBA3647]WAW14202.1 ComEC/Rec2 family competence protein [Peptostreptococcus sp. CBA3647]